MNDQPDTIIRNLEDYAGIASDWFWETDANHRFTYLSSRMEVVTGIRPEGVLGRRRNEISAMGVTAEAWQAHLKDLANFLPFRNFEYQLRRQNSAGLLWVQVSGDPVLGPNGDFKGYRGAAHDITLQRHALLRAEAANEALEERNQELDMLRQDLERVAMEDALTNLRNRRAFEGAIARALSQSDAMVGLLQIDLDHFKEVNDTMGHPAGDMVLRTVARRIKGLCSQRSEVFRIGGDEFSLLMGDCWSEDLAKTLGESIVREVAKPVPFEGQSLRVGASVGYAVTLGKPTSPQHLIARADTALYSAKDSGRNCVRNAAA